MRPLLCPVRESGYSHTDQDKKGHDPRQESRRRPKLKSKDHEKEEDTDKTAISSSCPKRISRFATKSQRKSGIGSIPPSFKMLAESVEGALENIPFLELSVSIFPLLLFDSHL